MIDLALHDEAISSPRQEGWRQAGLGLRGYLGLRRVHRPAAVAELRGLGATAPSHFERWADLYVRHGL